MELILPIEVTKNYRSSSQKVRVMTECWVGQLIFCPNCGTRLSSFQNNAPVADFYCEGCSEEFELKSKYGILGKKIVDGAYSSMEKRIKATNNPNFFFLTYDNRFMVNNFMVIPKYFFVTSILEKRPPLSDNARRAGWIGCNIVLENIPEFGKIYYVKSGVVKERNEILNKWKRTDFVRNTHNLDAKGWILDVLRCIEKLKKVEFSLAEIYGFEPELKYKHPLNNNIQAKIRQQLQFLRDKNLIEFIGNAKYKFKNINE